ncbi:Metallo-dependent phosphatase-like protein [Cladorrhinum sp. PSN259]|nr:Metallo-dependent phosphatase-like protein [Cladorrhinum sp. PSN259]
MIPQAVTHLFNRRAPRSMLFLIFGSLSFLTLCIFLLHLPSLQPVARIPISGLQDEKKVVSEPGQPGMTSLSTPAVAPGSTTSLMPDEDPPHHNHHQSTNTHHISQADQMPIAHIDENEDDEFSGMTQFTNHHPPILPSPTLIADLPASAVLPSIPRPTSSSTPKSRIIVVGDVHGNLEPLKELLKKIEFSPHNNYDFESNGKKHGGTRPPHQGKTRDQLVFVGDMITRGPDSRGVVDLAMKVGASAVRGNHEDRVLAAARGMKKLDRNEWTAQDLSGENQYHSSEEESPDPDTADPEALNRKKKHKSKDDHARKIAKSLSRSQLRWLESLPIILRLGHFPFTATASPSPPWDAGTIVVVHGGLVPGVKLESQDPWAVMNMRSLLYPRHRHHGKKKGPKHKTLSSDNDEFDLENDDTPENEFTTKNTVTVPIDTRKGEPWSRAWNRYQNALSLSSRLHNDTMVVIYGHDAKAGLQADMEVDISPYSSSKNNNNKKKKKSKGGSSHGNNNRKKKPKGVRYAFGLDSGCGHGKQLTGLVIEAVEDEKDGGKQRIKHKLVQVDCGGEVSLHGEGQDQE